MEYRWLTFEEIETFVNPVCKQQGWAELGLNEEQPTCRVLGAVEGVEIVGFLAFQLMPMLGPAWADSNHRDGVISRQLADKMHEFLTDVGARGAITICENPVTERLAERHAMQPVGLPVYWWVNQ